MHPKEPATLPFRLLLVTDWSLGDEVLLERVEDALRAGPGLAVQHRHPGASGRSFFEQGLRLAALCQRFAAPLFVNGRLDVALALGAHLHLPSRGLPVAAVRRHLPPGRWVSAAVHDAAQAAEARGADLALVSPVFPGGSKAAPAEALLGAQGFHRLARLAGCPAFALGGVTAEALGALRPVAGAAVISAVLAAQSPRAAAAELLALAALNSTSPPPARQH